MTVIDLLRRSSQLLTGLGPDGNIKPLNVDAYGNLLTSGGNSAASGGSNTNAQSIYSEVISSTDLKKTFTYTDTGTLDERITSIQYQSAMIGISFTEAYTYSGSSGSYRVISFARHQQGTLNISATNPSLYSQLLTAPDLLKTFTYADVGTIDERMISIQCQSAIMGISFTESYVYSGMSGGYRIASLSRSQL